MMGFRKKQLSVQSNLEFRCLDFDNCGVATAAQILTFIAFITFFPVICVVIMFCITALKLFFLFPAFLLVLPF